MICEICNENEAALTIIPTGEGMPQTVCPACLHRMTLTTMKNYLSGEEIAATLGPMFVTPAREDLHQGAEAERKRRPRKSKAKAEATQGEVGGEVETSAPAANE